MLHLSSLPPSPPGTTNVPERPNTPSTLLFPEPCLVVFKSYGTLLSLPLDRYTCKPLSLSLSLNMSEQKRKWRKEQQQYNTTQNSASPACRQAVQERHSMSSSRLALEIQSPPPGVIKFPPITSQLSPLLLLHVPEALPDEARPCAYRCHSVLGPHFHKRKLSRLESLDSRSVHLTIQHRSPLAHSSTNRPAPHRDATEQDSVVEMTLVSHECVCPPCATTMWADATSTPVRPPSIPKPRSQDLTLVTLCSPLLPPSRRVSSRIRSSGRLGTRGREITCDPIGSTGDGLALHREDRLRPAARFERDRGECALCMQSETRSPTNRLNLRRFDVGSRGHHHHALGLLPFAFTFLVPARPMSADISPSRVQTGAGT
ncbi:hypothetical protein Mapa_011010 [Marchantia paleacea]|nr:hypothetical protein Mapa_011010 [Marchantia paleacea]